MRYLSFLLLVLGVAFVSILQSCRRAPIQGKTETITVWINSLRAPCDDGTTKMRCFRVYKGDDLNEATWENLFSNIEGFEFEPGFFKKVKLASIAHVDSEVKPVTAYRVVEVLETREDERVLLNDIWAAETFLDKPLKMKGNRPVMEIDITKMKISGNDGCNTYFGDIKALTDNKIEFDKVGATRKLCADMDVPDTYHKLLGRVARFKRTGLKLHLLDAEGKVLIGYQKID